MAKKAARGKAKPAQVLSHLRVNVKKLQRDAQAVLSRTHKETARLNQDQKRALQRVASEAQQLRSDFDKAVKQASKDLKSQSKQLLSALRKEAAKRAEPVLKQWAGRDADLREEVRKLSRRLEELERLVTEHSHQETSAAAPKESSPFPPEPAPPET